MKDELCFVSAVFCVVGQETGQQFLVYIVASVKSIRPSLCLCSQGEFLQLQMPQTSPSPTTTTVRQYLKVLSVSGVLDPQA